MYRKISFILILASVVLAQQQQQDEVYEKCGLNIQCAEKKFVAMIDEYEAKDRVDMFGGVVTVVKKQGPVEPVVGDGLIGRAARYLANHEITLSAPVGVQQTARALDGDARSSKIKKILLPLLLLLKLKAAIILPIVLTVIGLVSFKGLGVGLAALGLSAFSMLKSVLDGKTTTQRVTYGVIPVPHEPHWSRASPSAPAVDYADVADPYYRTMPQYQYQ